MTTPATSCYICSNPGPDPHDLRTCDICRRPVCRSCALTWPLDELALKWGRASCVPCVDGGARRIVEEARETLRNEGLEELEPAPRFEEFGL